MDANGTRFHLLQGEADWLRASRLDVAWDGVRSEITLWPRVFRFTGAKRDVPLAIGDRRGAARDAFGNWYWIADDRRSVLVLSSGSRRLSTFWPAACEAECARPADEGAFRARTSAPSATPVLCGLAVTEDHYLVVGRIGTAGAAGLLIFDLYSGGPPRLRAWPVDFEPFDIAPREGGGVWVLDRAHRAVWELGPRFEVLTLDARPEASEPGEPPFANADGSGSACAGSRTPLTIEQAWPAPGTDPIGIVSAGGGAILVLDRDDGSGFGRVFLLEAGTVRGAAVSLRTMLEHVDTDVGQDPFTLVAHDFALCAREPDDPDAWLGRLFASGQDGNQAYAFGVARTGDTLALDAQPDYYPMRLFGGRAIVAAEGDPYYDANGTWVRLQKQKRPRYVESGEITTPVLDGGEPGCVWHRLMLDACIPPGTEIEVRTRAADDWRELTRVESLSTSERRALGVADTPGAGAGVLPELAAWQSEPMPRMRGDGPELPYLPRESGIGRGTWELLFQSARGRYLQVKLVLEGDARSTPRVRALRAWYPRFSYLSHYLPAVYRDDVESASFLDRFLANIEGMFTTIEDRMAAAQMLFDVASAPPDALDWLGTWFGVALDPAWEDRRRRLFLRHAMEFFAARGTIRGLQLALRLALDDCADDRLFAASTAAARRAAPFRIVERFRTRHTPGALVGDVTTAVPGPKASVTAPGARWQPATGGGELHRRYRERFDLPVGSEFPLGSAAVPVGWDAFSRETLGFVPRAGAEEERLWRKFEERLHGGSTSSLNAKHGTSGVTFATLQVPADAPTSSGLADDWRRYLAATPTSSRDRWQRFLARRYRSTDALNAAWRTAWTGFSTVPLFARVPPDGPALGDWYQFESVVLAMHQTAHRFTVMLPVRKSARADVAARQRRLALARRVLDLEKPAHTAYDVRFYWAMFRLGEARLGDDTLLDRGSRSPELMAPMVLGEGYLAEAFLSAPAGLDARDRLQLGRDRLDRSTRVGGP